MVFKKYYYLYVPKSFYFPKLVLKQKRVVSSFKKSIDFWQAISVHFKS